MKQLIFLRGVSGSGKSTLAISLEKAYNGIAISADDYFINDAGTYIFDEKEIGKAHKSCIEQTKAALIGDDYEVIIIHNTSVSNHDVEFYRDIAIEYNASFTSLVVENRHEGKNIHNISDEKIERQALNLLNNIKVINNLSYTIQKTKPRDYSKLEIIEFLSDYTLNLDEGLIEIKNRYDINSTKLNGKILLKYSESADKNLVIVRECRGLIIDEKLNIISLPFEKFGNYLESYAHNDIDLKDSKVVEKLDGSNFVLYYDQLNKKWCVQTLGQIEGEFEVTSFQNKNEDFTWSEMFWETFRTYTVNVPKFVNALSKDYSYMFELCSPYNQVVVKHVTAKLYFLGLRNKVTLLEENPISCPLHYLLDTPKQYEFSGLHEIRKVCMNDLTSQEEGFIVVDSMFRRVKMKSLKYVEEHYVSTVQTLKSITNVVFQNEDSEYLTIFPEHTELINEIKKELVLMGDEIDKLFSTLKNSMIDQTNAKEFSILVESLKRDFKKSHLYHLFNNRYKNGLDGWEFCPKSKMKGFKPVEEKLIEESIVEKTPFQKKKKS